MPLAWLKPYVIPSLAQMKQAAARWEKQGVSLRQVGQVTMDGIPEWAIKKAVRGLTLTETSVWLTRKHARKLFRDTRNAGLKVALTMTYWRPCPHCKRPLLGIDAEERARLDRMRDGRALPCSPDCEEIAASKRKRRGGCVSSEGAGPSAKLALQRQGNHHG